MTDVHDTADLVSKALRRAWQLGQTYWQQADSEYQSHWKKADATQATFGQLVKDTRAVILADNSGAQPAPSVPEGWTLVPIEPTPTMVKAGLESSHVLNVHRVLVCYDAMIDAAPEAKP